MKAPSSERPQPPPRPHWAARLLSLSVAAAALAQVTCSTPLTTLERIQANDVLRVVTRNAGTTYYLDPEGETGPEYELASAFADQLGVRLELLTADSVAGVLDTLRDGRADVAAAHLTITPARSSLVRFGPVYQQIDQYVVYRVGERRPRRVEDLAGLRLEVLAGSAHAEALRTLSSELTQLRWNEVEDASVESLLERVSSGEIDATIADSSAFALMRRYHPEIRRAFDLITGDRIAWAVRREDHGLYAAVTGFFVDQQQRGVVDRMLYRYYDHTERFDYVGTRQFIRDIDSKLPLYRAYFEEAAALVGIEWRLLAAIGYQESHWNPAAVSPTGVRGIMMLTHATSSQMNVDDRTDPRQSIMGGARYFVRVRDKLPERIPEPDRTWMALAAYNIGYGHLEDARIITQINGFDADRWEDVRRHLPLLTRKRWYSRVKRGYARGYAPVIYVRNVRSYRDILAWITSDERPADVPATKAPAVPLPFDEADLPPPEIDTTDVVPTEIVRAPTSAEGDAR